MKMDSNRWLRGVGIAGLAFSALVAGVAWAADKEAPEAIRVTVGPWLGVTLAEEQDAGSGAKVTSVMQDSPAAKAGLKKGDVVVAMNGDRVVGPATLTEMIHASKAGDTIKLDVLRDGRKQALSAELAERKNMFRVLAPGFEGSWDEDARIGMERMRELREQLPELERMRFRLGSGPRLGVELVRTTPELRTHLGAPDDHGVLVGKVLPGSAAEKAGIKVGDVLTTVDGAEVSSAGGILEALADKSGQGVDIELVRDGKGMKVRADLPKLEEDEATGPRAHHIPVPPLPLI